MKRYPDWPMRLHAFIDGVKRNPFDWASHNCGLFVAGAIEAMTGENVAKGFGKAKTVRGLVAQMKRQGFDDLASLAAFMAPEIHISQANIGDVAAIPKDDAFGYTLGVVNGETIAVLGELGLGYVPLLQATRAFRIG